MSSIATRVACFLSSAALLTVSVRTVPASEAKRPNIVLILADDLGYGDVGCFREKPWPEGRELSTPRLDRMAKEGMKLPQFYAGATVCAPSRCVLLTGRHGGRTVVRGNSTEPIVVEPGTPTVASVLKAAGYETACIGKWGVGTPDDFTNPGDVGFDHFFGYVNMWHAHNFYPEFLVRNGEVVRLKNKVAAKWAEWRDPTVPKAGRGVAEVRAEYAPDLFVEESLKFIRDNRDGPFFLYFAMNVPHANNEAGKLGMEVPDLGEYADRDWPEPEKGFAAMVRNLDRDTGRILDLLRELKIAENTLVVFTSDNGPHAEGGHDADFFDSNSKYRGIKRDLAEGGIRVPTIAWWPSTVPAGGENVRQWYFGDVLATFAELAGAEIPDGLDSDSFVTALDGTDEEGQWKRNGRLYWEFYERGSAQAVRFGKWKAIRSPMFTGPVELYDLSWDHDEDHDYAERRPKLAEHAKNLLDKAHEPDPNWRVGGK